MLKKLTSPEGVNEMIIKGISKKENGKKTNFKLNRRFQGTTLSNLKQDIKDCDIKFFIEKNPFDEENMGIDFEDITSELF